MSNFSPYIYELKDLPMATKNKVKENLFDYFTFLDKPNKRNVYKISIAQLIHYLVDFGIGYNSVCSTTVTKPQQFHSTMYVNRHDSQSNQRPATVVDLKEKLLKAVQILIKETVQTNKNGVKVVDTVYPKYFFTLDTSLTPAKLKQLTGLDYVKVDDFKDFPFTKTATSSSTITRANGYIPSSEVLMCPNHNHGGDVNDGMKNSISYSWGLQLSPKGGVGWWGHLQPVYGQKANGSGEFRTQRDTTIDKYNVPPSWDENSSSNVGKVKVPSMSPSWQFPTSVSCYLSDPVPPRGSVGGQVCIRFPGRRYILFKQVES